MEKNLPVTFATNVIKFVERDNQDAKQESVAYSGDIVDYVDGEGESIQIIINLDNIKLNPLDGETYPMVFSHDVENWIGHFRLINDGQLKPVQITMLDNLQAKDVVDAYKKGFPLKASIHVVPGFVEYIDPQSSAVINGRTVSNVHVYHDCIVKEMSATAVPRDKNTPLHLFSESETNHTHSKALFKNLTVREKMSKAQTPPETDLSAQLAEAKAELLASKQALSATATKLAESDAERIQLQSENAKLAEETAAAALELRTKEIADLESLVGKFEDTEKEKLLALDADTFEFVSKMVMRIFEGMKSENTGKPQDAPEASENMTDALAVQQNAQMSQPRHAHAALLANQAHKPLQPNRTQPQSINSPEFIDEQNKRNSELYGYQIAGVK